MITGNNNISKEQLSKERRGALWIVYVILASFVGGESLVEEGKEP